MAFGKKKREKAQALFETGSRGVGEVVDVADTGMTINDNPRVKMRFRIEPLDGGAPFEAEKTTTVSRVEIPRVGDRFPTWYDPADASSWAYATVNDDQGRAQIRQLFGAAAETMSGFGGGGAAAAPVADPAERLRKLEELRTAGLINDEEFAAKKAELLAGI
jgi:hypothetical protein